MGVPTGQRWRGIAGAVALALAGGSWMPFPLVSAAADAQAGKPLASGDPAAGREKSSSCLACHGALGDSDNDAWPDLAGQSPGYLARQLRAFREGRRHDPWMSQMAEPLSDQDIADLAAWFGSLPGLRPGPAQAPGPAASCVACHSQTAEKLNPDWPRLAGQNEPYLARQLQLFRDGGRQDPSMTALAQSLPPAQLAELARYYANL